MKAIRKSLGFLLLILSIHTYSQFVPKWDQAISSPIYDEYVDFGVDNSGNIYVVGHENNTNQDIVLIKCDDSGCAEIATYSHAEDATAFKLEVDPSNGDCYIVGSRVEDNGGGGSPTGKLEALALKYDSEGNQDWQDVYDGNTSTTAASRSQEYYDAFFNGTSLFVTGYSNPGGFSSEDVILARFSSGGTRTFKQITDASSADAEGYKIKVVGSTVHLGALDHTNELIEYYTFSTSFGSSSSPLSTQTTSSIWKTEMGTDFLWTSIDAMDTDGSTIALGYDAGSSAEIEMYNGSSWTGASKGDLTDVEDILIDGSNVILTGREFVTSTFSHYELAFIRYLNNSSSVQVDVRLDPNPLVAGNDHQAYSSKGTSLYKNADGDYSIIGTLVLDDDPTDGNPAINPFAGEVQFDISGNQLGWDIYEVSAFEVTGGKSDSDNLYIVSEDKVWVLCNAPSVDLGADISEPYDPSGNDITLDAGAGFTYLWSTGATTQTIDVSSSGTYSVTITNASGCTATDEVAVDITPIDQTITWDQTIDLEYRSSVTLNASSNSGLAIVYETNSVSIAEVDGSTLEGTGVGEVTITATQPGSEFYNAATSVVKMVDVGYAQYFWVGDGGDFIDPTDTHWATESGGITMYNDPPDQFCDVFFDANSFSTPNQTVNLSLFETASCHDLSFISVTNNPTVDLGDESTDLFGSLHLGSDINYNMGIDFLSDEMETITVDFAELDAANWNFKGSGTYEIVGTTKINNLHLVIEDGTLEVSGGSSLTLSGSSLLELQSAATFDAVGSLVLESGTVFYDETGSTISGTNYTFKRNARFANQGKYSVYGSPVQNASTSSLGSLVYQYNESEDYEPNEGLNRFVEVSSPVTMTPGVGFFSAFDDEVSVTGVPNSDSEFVAVSFSESSGDEADYDGFTLVANPFPAPLNIDDLLSTNGPDGTGLIEGSIYIWNDGGSDVGRRSNDDYVVYNPLGSPSGFSGVATSFQGFFVKATGLGTITMSPGMRSKSPILNDDAEFFRKEAPFKVILELSDENRMSSALVGYMGDADKSLDKKYDALRLGGRDFSISSLINDKPYVIQGRQSGFETDTCAISYTTDKVGLLTLKLSVENQPQSFATYLYDKQLEELIEVTESLNYEFISNGGSHNDRFEIIATKDLITTHHVSDDQVTFEKRTNELIIKASGGIRHLSIYSISGKKLLDKAFVKTPQSISRVGLSGTIIVNVRTSENTLISRKLQIR